MFEIAARTTADDDCQDDCTTAKSVAAKALLYAQVSPAQLGHHLRLLNLTGYGATAREQWLRQVAAIEQIYNLNSSSVCYLSQSRATFTILLFSGSNIEEMEFQLKLVQDILPSKILVPVLSSVSRVDVARLLLAGADDVLHVDIDPLEAKARLLSLLMQKNWRSARMRHYAEINRQCQLASISTRHRLAAAEVEVLEKLIKWRDQIVPYVKFTGKSRIGNRELRKGLAVRIHSLRVKLGRDWVIRNVRGKGYLLERESWGPF